MMLDVVNSWSRGDECPYEVFHEHEGDGYSPFYCGDGLETQYPRNNMFFNEYVTSIFLRFSEERRGIGFPRGYFISRCHNKERLAALEFMYNQGFIKVIFLEDGQYYFTLTGLGNKIASVCADGYSDYRLKQLRGMAS